MTYVPNGNIFLPSFLQDFCKYTVLLEFEVHLCLIRFDFYKHIARCDSISNLLLPGAYIPGCHCW